MSTLEHGALIVFTGPSGVGKGTVLDALEASGSRFFRSVSATTREPRPGEIDHGAYYFLTIPEFRNLIETDQLLEYAEYLGQYYGTPAAPVDEALAAGRDVILEIEVQGALQIRAKRPDAVLVFLMPPSMEELERRLRKRGTESEDKIRKRLAKATSECAMSDAFDYKIISDVPEIAAARLAEIIRAARRK
ncbi:MAG: guanylate kinase [Clostridiaceae bacterium]|nr:guanylate kinase [Clostridiaceae bacterium]